MAQHSLESREAQIVQTAKKSYNPSLVVNLTQVPRLEEEIGGRQVHPPIKFERITRHWHQRLGIDSCSLVLVLKVKSTTTDEPKITYEGVFEGEEVVVLMLSTILGIGHYHWLQGPILQVEAKHKAKFFPHIMHHILEFLQLQ